MKIERFLVQTTALFCCGILCMTVTGCATRYGSMGFMGGVESTPLQTGTEMIAARGNAFTDSMKIQQFVLLKAAEDCLSSGYQKFAFTSAQDVSRSGSIVLPGQTYSNSMVTGFGNSAMITTNSYSTPPTVIPTIKPGANVVVKFYKANEPAPSNAFDARQIVNNLAPRLEH